MLDFCWRALGSHESFMLRNETINRRTFLRGLGGAVLALPHLEAMAASGSPAVPVRMVCVGINYGFVPQLFFPSKTGLDYEAPLLLKPLERHRSDFTVFSQLDHGVNGQGGHAGVHAYLSGILSKNSKGFVEANMSMDQKAAQHVGVATRYPSMQLTSGSDINNLISWSSAGVAIPPVEGLDTIFSSLFRKADPQQLSSLDARYAAQASILDLVKTDADHLRRRLGNRDREKLDQYFTSVRSVEKQLSQSREWLDRPKPSVDYQLPRDADSLDLVDRVPIYYDLMALALETDSTRVITFTVNDLGPNSGGLGVSKGYHQLTHHGKVPSYIDELSIIERFHTTQFARFLDQLKAVEEPDGRTLLDNTMALLGSGIGNASSHSNKDLPLLLAGGGFRHGEHKSYEATPASNLFVSMLQRFGMEIDQFGRSSSTLTGLEAA